MSASRPDISTRPSSILSRVLKEEQNASTARPPPTTSTYMGTKKKNRKRRAGGEGNAAAVRNNFLGHFVGVFHWASNQARRISLASLQQAVLDAHAAGEGKLVRDLIAEAHVYSEGAAAHTSQEAAEESLALGTLGLPFRAATLSCGAIYQSVARHLYENGILLGASPNSGSRYLHSFNLVISKYN